MKPSRRWRVLVPMALVLVGAMVVIGWRFNRDMALARSHAAQGSVLLPTRCGLIEYQEAGAGVPLLVVHGSGGGQDRGMALAGALAAQGVRVIALSRFGYLRTPMPLDASVDAQADAHVCLLDALGVHRAAVIGYSAGAPSAVQMAIRHPERVSALVLLMPLAYKPAGQTDTAATMPVWAESAMMRLGGSDFLVWAAIHMARNQVIEFALATPPELLTTASPSERARVNAMLDEILPVVARAEGLAHDIAAARHLGPAPLESIRAPTLIVSARDDRYGTFAGAQYTADHIADARFIGFDQGGHTWIGHDEEVHSEILKLLRPPGRP